MPHFASKALIEEHIKANGGDKILSTILRPVAFSDNWPAPGDPAAAFLGACLEVGLKPTTKLQLVSTVDIGKLAALIIHDRARFAGRTVDVVGDSLTWPEIQRVYREVVGVEAPTIPDFKLANAGPEMETMCVFLCASSPRPIVREALIRFPSPCGDVGSDGSRRSATTPRSTRCTRSSRRRTLPAISAERTSMRRDRPTFYRCTRSFIPHTNACFSFFFLILIVTSRIVEAFRSPFPFQPPLRGFFGAGALRGRIVMPSVRLRSGSACTGSVDETVEDGVIEGGSHGAACALRTGLAALAAADAVVVDGVAAADGRPIDFHADIESLARVANELSDGCCLARIDGSAEREVWASIGGSVKRSASASRFGAHFVGGSALGMAGGARGARLYDTGTGPRRIDEAILNGGGAVFVAGVGDGGA